jgi:leucyl aminopeptidase
VKCAVADETALRRDRCLSVLAVGQGSANPPRLVTLTYPGKRRKEPPVVLVGKTITFDTGGISIKPSRNMEWMKYDKSGGMAALAAVLLAARLKLDHPVVAILAMAENMPGSRATRPGDIVRSRSGKTIEIINTDAEGRLVLADALSIAAGLRPRAIVDLATLTGACVVALGHVAAGVMGNDETLLKGLQAAGDAAGERLWPLPLLPEYGEALKTPFADLKNVGEEGAGAIVGGAFLEAFVPAGVPWAHIDIAGTAWEEREKPYGAPGATLFGPGLLVEWIRRLPPKR